jgi:methyl-accepting chemotaxis protein
MNTHGRRFGLRLKLIIAFLLIAVTPILFLMVVSSRQTTLTQQQIQQFQAYDAKLTAQILDSYAKRQIFYWVVTSFVAVVACGVAFYFGKILTRPILQLTTIAQKISEGELDHTTLRIHAQDELGDLRDAFTAMTVYIQTIAKSAQTIAQGNVQEIRPPQNPHDVLGAAFHVMEQYLQAIVTAAHQIADGDFISPIPVKSAQDVLGNAFRKMTGQLVETLRQVKSEVQLIEQASETTAKRSEQDMKMVEDVLSSAEETSSSMMEMQASVEEVSENMKALAMAIEETVTSIEEMGMAIKHIAFNSSGLSSSAEETFKVIQEISGSIERLVETSNEAEVSSREASDAANAGQVSVKEIMEGMQVIHDVVSKSAEMIKTLGSRSEEIGTITNVITEIADQTALLALNASIIAAQAGEHGRGFAVVAQEVKELANRSSNAAKEIGVLIQAVQAESQKAVTSMTTGR